MPRACRCRTRPNCRRSGIAAAVLVVVRGDGRQELPGPSRECWEQANLESQNALLDCCANPDTPVYTVKPIVGADPGGLGGAPLAVYLPDLPEAVDLAADRVEHVGMAVGFLSAH